MKKYLTAILTLLFFHSIAMAQEELTVTFKLVTEGRTSGLVATGTQAEKLMKFLPVSTRGIDGTVEKMGTIVCGKTASPKYEVSTECFMVVK